MFRVMFTVNNCALNVSSYVYSKQLCITMFRVMFTVNNCALQCFELCLQ